MDSDSDVKYWVQRLGVDEAQLRALVRVHGHSATIIREAIEREKSAA